MYTCVREGPWSVWSGRARTHRPDDGATPILGAHGCAQTERSPRRERPLPRTQHTRRRRREWAKSGASVGALRSRLARTAVGVHARRSLDAADSVRWSRAAGDLVPGEKCGTPRRAHQLLSCDGLSGVNGSVASRGVSAAYTIHVRVYIFATARAAAAHRRREASQQPTPDARVRNVPIPQGNVATDPPAA